MDLSEYDLSSRSMTPKPESLFERCHWLYALFREYLFRDHTPEISRALFPSGVPACGTHLLELGCGPGLYACRFAQEYPQITTIGIDQSKHLIQRARSRAHSFHLQNCNFCEGDAQALPEFPYLVDAVVVSRLFLIIPDREAVLGEIFRVLRPGGRCFIAEPTSAFATRLPLSAMWLLARLNRNPCTKFREPHQVEVMSRQNFSSLIEAQPWESVEMNYDDWYQYAVCVKSHELQLTDESVA
jgi:arsenite methyltransferase